MSVYDKLNAKTSNIKARDLDGATNKPLKTAPGMFLNTVKRIEDAEARVEELETELQTIKETQTQDIPLQYLTEVEGRRRKLSDEQFLELKNNLSKNPLVQAITVRKIAENTYEIISGHNRVAAYRELGKEKIAAILLQEEDDSIVEASALYANLFQPDLSDYEKYLGFKKLLETTGKTQKQLALDAGVDEKSVSRWLSFGNLKEEALAIIETNPQKIGGRAVMTLASLTLEGKEKEVLHAIKAIIEGRVTQDAGVKLALQKNIEESTSLKKSESINIRMGKKIFCKMIPNKNTLRLNFQTEEQRMAVEEALKVVLSEHARELRKTIVDGE